MKKFIRYLTAFFIPIIIIGGMVEFLLRRIPNDYKLKKAYLDQHATSVQTLILGNSHTFYGIDPRFMMDKSFNAANVSQPLYFDYLILKKYEHNWKNLSKIIIPIDYFTLFLDLEEGGEGWRVKNYNLYFDMNASSDLASHTELLGSNFKINLKRLLSYYVLHGPGITSEKLGWGNSYKENANPNLQETGQSAQGRHTVKRYHLLKENLRILTSIIKFAQARNIEVVLITSPAYKSYYNGLNRKQVNITASAVANLKASYGVKYIDLLRDHSFQDIDFYDGDHLNENGAKKLSLKMNTLLNITN